MIARLHPRSVLPAAVVGLGLLLLLAKPSEAGDSVPTDPNGICPVLVGAHIPAVTVRGVDGTAHALADLVAQKPTILVFYRGGWCPFCNHHMGQLQQIEDEIVKKGFQILAICPDRPEKLGDSIERLQLGYTLLSDSPMSASRAFGLAFEVEPGTVADYKKGGIDIEADSGETHHQLPVPAIYLVGTDGMIRFAYMNPNYKVRLEPEVLMAAIDAYLN